MFYHQITQNTNIANIIQSTIAAAERVFELLDEEEEIPEETAYELSQVKGAVAFENVHFGYDEPLIENMNIHIKTGQTVAIVDPIVAEKSTNFNLIMHYYDHN